MKTTATYPNRVKDKERIERIFKLNEFGNHETEFFTKRGTLLAKGYVRIVYGDHGPYIEFDKSHIVAPLERKFSTPVPATAYYEWLVVKDGSNVKVYDQKKDVKNIPYTPKGGYREYRKEGYADYKPGMIYVSPWELQLTRRQQLSL